MTRRRLLHPHAVFTERKIEIRPILCLFPRPLAHHPSPPYVHRYYIDTRLGVYPQEHEESVRTRARCNINGPDYTKKYYIAYGAGGNGKGKREREKRVKNGKRKTRTVFV